MNRASVCAADRDGCRGERCGSRALQLIRKELDISMAFCGRTQIAQVDRLILRPGTYPVA